MSDIRFLDIRTDYVFKKLFEHKRLLISFLNAILKGKPYIEEVELGNTEIQIAGPNGKAIRLDILAKLKNGDKINIEMQRRRRNDGIDRAMHYLASIMTRDNCEPVDDDKHDYTFPKVIGIWVLDSNILDRATAVNEAVLAFTPNEQRSYEVATDKMRLFTIELPKFDPKKRRRQDMLDNWLTFLKDPLDTEVLEVADIKDAYEALKELSADERVRDEYRRYIEGQRDVITELNQVRNEERTEIAKKSLEKGLSIELIAEITGLTIEEIEDIKNKNRHC